MKSSTKCFALNLIFFLFYLSFMEGQSIAFISDKTSPYFGRIQISDFNTSQLKFISEEKNIRNIIRIYPSENWDNAKGELLPMLGEYYLINSTILFQPRFPFQEDKGFIIEFNFENKFHKKVTTPFFSNHSSTFIKDVFPTSPEWPANQLKIYIHFSNPMGMGNIYDHIKLLDEDGNRVEQPFLEIEPILWDKAQQRLTLWFDPGRIKRYLIPNQKMGTPLEEGKKYTLVISKNCTDAYGNNLINEFKKEFHTTAPDRKKPDPKKWIISKPISGSTEPLVIHFNEPMDKGTLESMIGITDEKENLLAGKIETENFEKTWKFIPKQKWESGNYSINFSGRLEDLAGNNIWRLFDSDIDQQVDNKLPPASINFTIF